MQACRGGFSRSGASSQACFGLIGVWSAALLGSYASTKLAFLETLDCDCELDGSASNVQSRNQTSCVVRIRLLDIRLVHGQYCAEHTYVSASPARSGRSYTFIDGLGILYCMLLLRHDGMAVRLFVRRHLRCEWNVSAGTKQPRFAGHLTVL